MPKTQLGKWSVGLIALFFLALGTLILLAASGQTGGTTFFSNPLLGIPGLGAGAAAIAAFFTGIISIWKYKERAIPVFIAAVIGLFVLLFVLGEILSPH